MRQIAEAQIGHIRVNVHMMTQTLSLCIHGYNETHSFCNAMGLLHSFRCMIGPLPTTLLVLVGGVGGGGCGKQLSEKRRSVQAGVDA